jgi:DNA polymerase epsilon subunit 2
MLTRTQAEFSTRLSAELPDLSFFVLSDVWLDHPATLLGLRRVFDHCVANAFVPKVVVLCGNFTSAGIAQGNSRDLQRYQGPSPYMRRPRTVLMSSQTTSTRSRT